jgi:hypothetical protein
MTDGQMFRVRGGVRIQGRGWYSWLWSFNATWPFAFLEADRSSIVINYSLGTVWINREHVVSIERYERGIGGVRFRSDDYDRDVIFWGDPLWIINSLRSLGWDVVG